MVRLNKGLFNPSAKDGTRLLQKTDNKKADRGLSRLQTDSKYLPVYKTITVCLFGLLCVVTLFVTSSLFINQKITPKWLAPVAGVCLAIAFFGHTAEEVALAQTIINKRVKIPSPTVGTIKRKTEKMLDSLSLITEVGTVRYGITIQALKDNGVLSCLMPLKPFKSMQPGQAALTRRNLWFRQIDGL
jgi:hypothetical protein